MYGIVFILFIIVGVYLGSRILYVKVLTAATAAAAINDTEKKTK